MVMTTLKAVRGTRDLLPPETVLATDLGLSRATVRQAIGRDLALGVRVCGDELIHEFGVQGVELFGVTDGQKGDIAGLPPFHP